MHKTVMTCNTIDINYASDNNKELFKFLLIQQIYC